MRLVFIFTLFIYTSLDAQSELKVVPLVGDEKIVLGEPILLFGGDTLTIHTLRFYISKIRFQNPDGEITTSDCYLMDLEYPESMTISDVPMNAKNLSFLLGTDSLTNVSGILSGPLDPINGMYWAWNSGYINFKLEGTISKPSENKKDFEFHIGGYQQPFPTSRHIDLNLNQLNSNKSIIALNLDTLFNSIDWNSSLNVMTPGIKAFELSNLLQKCFSISSDE